MLSVWGAVAPLLPVNLYPLILSLLLDLEETAYICRSLVSDQCLTLLVLMVGQGLKGLARDHVSLWLDRGWIIPSDVERLESLL